MSFTPSILGGIPLWLNLSPSPFFSDISTELPDGDLFWSHFSITGNAFAGRIYFGGKGRGWGILLTEGLEPMVEDNCPLPLLIAVKLLVTLLLRFIFLWLQHLGHSAHRLPSLLETSLSSWPVDPSLPGVGLLIFDVLPHHPREHTLGCITT